MADAAFAGEAWWYHDLAASAYVYGIRIETEF